MPQMNQMWMDFAQRFGRQSKDEIKRRRRSSLFMATLMAMAAAIIGKILAGRRTPEMAATSS